MATEMDSLARLPPQPQDAKPAKSPKKGGGATPKKTPKKKASAAQSPAKKRKTPSKSKSDTPAAKASAKKSPKSPAKKKATPAKPKSPKAGKPTFVVMIHDAIVALKDRTGSSVPAITKYLLANHDHLGKMNSRTMKNSVATGLKTAVKQERFIKVKASYKINAAWVKKEKAAARKKQASLKAKGSTSAKAIKAAEKKAKEAEKKRLAKEKKKKLAAEKKEKEKEKKRLKKEKEAEKKRLKKEREEKKAAEAKERKKRLEEEKRRKEEAAILRKRKFPMDDLALIAEDKHYGVKPPEDVKERPALPCVMLGAIPFEERKEDVDTNIKPYMTSAVSLSNRGSCNGSRGLMADLLQVYNFFRGDVGYSHINEGLTPDFTLKHLMCAVQEIICGNAKKARVVPPIITHLFVTALRIVTEGKIKQGDESDDEEEEEESEEESEEEDSDEEGEEGESKKAVQQLSPQEQQLRDDLSQLHSMLGPMAPVTWAEVCYCYMDTMHRFYTSSASLDPNTVSSIPVDKNFFGFGDPTEKGKTSSASDEDKMQDDDGVALPSGYAGYLGKPRASLARAWSKLRRIDPWMLSAEELMALLRALTDDILSNDPSLAEDISERVGELEELRKEKRLADQEFNKVRRAFLGPKKPGKSKKETDNDEAPSKDSSENQEESKDAENADESSAKPKKKGKKTKKGENEDGEEKFKPTVTEKEFNAAEKAQQKALENYEKGLKKLIARTEPVGLDRFGNNVYFFQHDPESLYVEVIKPTPASFVPETVHDAVQGTARTWQIIDNKSLYDEFIACLDVRGIRESELWENINGGNSYLRRFLYDDQKRINAKLAREKAIKDLESRLENAKIHAESEEGGRRSGRLANIAHDVVTQLEKELKELTESELTDTEEEPLDYEDFTGLTILSEFEAEQEEEEEEDEDEEDEEGENPGYGICSNLWYKDREDEDGVEEDGAVGLIVDAILHAEEHCNDLAPWQRKDITRESWRDSLRNIIRVWKEDDTLQFGPPPPEENVTQPAVTPPAEEEVSGDKKKKKSKKSLSDTPGKGTPAKNTPGKKGKGGKKAKGKSKKDEGTPVKPVNNTAELVEALKEPLLNLEHRIYTITGLRLAAEAADEAGVTFSDEVDDDEEMENYKRRAQQAWKKEVSRLTRIPTGRGALVKSIIIAAMTIARRAHLSDVLAELRAALLLHRTSAPNAAKMEAIGVLEKHGGYYKKNDEGEEFDVNAEDPDAAQDEMEPESMLNNDVLAIKGFLSGNDHADRVDWTDAVKSCSTLSKLAALTQAFVAASTEILNKIDTKRDNLLELIESWERSKKTKKNLNVSNEVWADFEISPKFCMAKIAGYPWWPARICNPTDKSIASSLKSLDRVLVAFVGEENMYVLKEDEIKPYTGDKEDELTSKELSRFKLCDDQTKKAYEQCIYITRRIARKRGIIAAPRKKAKYNPSSFEDEKKTAY